MPEPPLTGGCLCGGVRYEVTEPLLDAVYCHCTRCQRSTGTAASVSALVAPDSLHVTKGAELMRSYQPPGGFRNLFCSQCGTGLFSEHPDDADLLWVRLGTLDSDPGVRPSYRQYVAYAAAWEPIPQDLERFPERGPT